MNWCEIESNRNEKRSVCTKRFSFPFKMYLLKTETVEIDLLYFRLIYHRSLALIFRHVCIHVGTNFVDFVRPLEIVVFVLRPKLKNNQKSIERARTHREKEERDRVAGLHRRWLHWIAKIKFHFILVYHPSRFGRSCCRIHVYNYLYEKFICAL